MSQKTSHLLPIIPLPLSEAQLKEIVEKSKDWVLMHGISMRPKTQFDEDGLRFLPFVLIPSVFPRKEFEKACEMQSILNELMHKVAHDRCFFTESLKDIVKVDEFTRNLFRIYETVVAEGLTQRVCLGLLRSDYMVDLSLGGIGTNITAFHRYLLRELGHTDTLKNLPENNALKGLCGGLIEAWKIYANPEAVILFLIAEITYKICDQRLHEFKIREMCPQVRVIRRTFTDIAARASLGPKKQLLIDGCEVAVIYFRTGFAPEHYHSHKEWEARFLMERSLAIKAPSIHYHLAGTKKVQQTLAKPGALEQFLSDPLKVAKVKQIFGGLYSLDSDELGEQAVQMAIDDPEKFVLKPQREGGGNNVYGLEVRDAVKKMKDSEERTAWILMERIRPPLTMGYMVRPGGNKVSQLVEVVSELGIYGVVIGDAENITYSKQVGHILRTKPATANEGSTSSGPGALDSPHLID
ncbi:glutathione synthetase isoform X2 [Tribolium castaneum]|uniref:glutathione synthetase isoform X2 n=1 Tax=Tribolium castaneum TaxID=7070 RepID=UPI00077DE32B|nr:PREDICTED: glutathione synthetase isoform X2 [Tribolium castaneum]|eukprot:XP_015836716.1 PREDICTED: glutathione synthetase isoform X2 [Tribolium castaneum]